MTLEAIRKSLEKEAGSKASDMEKEASAEAERIISDAKQRAKQVANEIEARAANEMEKMQMESRASADIEAGAMLLEAQGEAVERSLRNVMSALSKEIGKTDMKKLLEKGLKEFEKSYGSRGLIISVSKKNAAIAKGLGAKVEYMDDNGFVITTEDGKIALNASAESLLASEKGSARSLVYEGLFGKPHAHVPSAVRKKNTKKVRARTKAKGKKRKKGR